MKILLFVSLLFLFLQPNTASALPRTEKEFLQLKIKEKLIEHGVPYKTFFHIIEAESRYRVNAVNYNCRYEGKSMSCKPQDRYLAHSVDCGLLQINIKGQKCPKYLFDIDVNLSQGINLYLQRGFQPWDSSAKKWKPLVKT